jgi:hypothetical protein
VGSFQQVIDQHFQGTLSEAAFVERSREALTPLGFSAENTIACVGLCRDEICRPLVARVGEGWGEAFNFSSLAGMLFLGKTGFGAAHGHAPRIGGRQRYLYLVAPHIAIGQEGVCGECHRIGQTGPSHACGALCGFLGELEAGRADAALDPDDIEQSLLKARLLQHLHWGQVPTLVELTRLTHDVILADLERMIDLTVDTETADYAVLSGVQIHGPEGAALFWPKMQYAVIQGTRRPFSFPA